MTPKAFRAFARSLPGATEEPHFERTMVAPRQAVYALIREQPDVFFSHGGWTERFGSVGVHMAKADEEQLRALIAASYERKTEKKKK